MPMQGFSAKFDTLDKAIAFPQAGSTFITTNSDWTMTYWMKTDTAFQNADLLTYPRMSLFIKTINSNSGNEGIEVYNSTMGSPIITVMFVDLSLIHIYMFPHLIIVYLVNCHRYSKDTYMVVFHR